MKIKSTGPGAIALAAVSAALVVGCSISAQPSNSAHYSNAITGSAPPATTAFPSAAVTSLASPSPTPLPVEPVLVGTANSVNEVDYEVAVRPSSVPLDQTTAKAWATKMGALIGLGAPDTVFQSDSWTAYWGGSIEGYPVDPAGVVLEMDTYGTVQRFWRITGPMAPLPAHIITESHARQVAEPQGGHTIDTARLAWARFSSDPIYRLVWRLHVPISGPGGEDFSCMVSVDASTATIVETACIS